MKILRTPDSRFENLPGYPFLPNYIDIGGVRMHYVKEGDNDNELVLMLHGEPSWSYLYRKMIPIVVKAGYSAIAPDLIGFGKSDKLAEASAYSYQSHMDWMTAFVTKLDLTNITLVCQDWGGLIGLRLATENEDRFKRVLVANTILPTGDTPPNKAFDTWKNYAQSVEVFPVGGIVNKGCVNDLPAEVVAAYDAPFLDETYKACARVFPNLVPVTPDDPAAVPNRKAWDVLKKWKKPFLTAFSDSDPIMAGFDKVFQDKVPGAKGQNHITIKGAGHFLQEDKGDELAATVVSFIKANE